MALKRYRLHSGMLAFIFHRISGLALIFYLPMHIWVTHHVTTNPEKFDELMKFLAQPLFKLGEVFLLAAILYHAFNGFRIICIDMDIIKTPKAQRITFWMLFLAMFPILFYAGYVFLLKH